MTTNAAPDAPSFVDMIEIDLPGRRPEGSPEDTDTRLFTPDEIAPSHRERQAIPALGDIAEDSARMAATPTTSRTYLTPEQRAEIRAREGVAFPARPAPQHDPEPAPAILSGSTMIAGAVAEGEAVLCGWDGSGELTRGKLAELVAAAGMPAEILPAPRTARAQLGRAVADACGSTYDHRIEKASEVEGDRPYAARWTIGAVNHGGQVGDAYGRLVATVTLGKGGELTIDSSDTTLADAIRDDYARRVAAEVYNSADVTGWLRGVLCSVLGGVKLGGVYYVPRTGAARAEALCTSLATAWGSNWIAPALPVATTDQLRRGIVAGLAAEADDVIRRFELARETAREEHAAGTRKSTDLTARAVATFLAEMRTVAERTVAYVALLGADLVAPLRDRCVAAMETMLELTDNTTQRASLIWEEIEAERDRGITRETEEGRARAAHAEGAL